jgi:hypothetical protein
MRAEHSKVQTKWNNPLVVLLELSLRLLLLLAILLEAEEPAAVLTRTLPRALPRTLRLTAFLSKPLRVRASKIAHTIPSNRRSAIWTVYRLLFG